MTPPRGYLWLSLLGGGPMLLPWLRGLEGGRRRLWVSAAALLSLGTPLLAPWNWMTVAALVFLMQAALAGFLLAAAPPSPARVDTVEGPLSRWRAWSGFAALTPGVACLFAPLEMLISDRLWSRVLAVNFSPALILSDLFRITGAYILPLSGAAFFLTRTRRNWTLPGIFTRLCMGGAVLLLLRQAGLLLFTIPEAHSAQAGAFPVLLLRLREAAVLLVTFAFLVLVLCSREEGGTRAVGSGGRGLSAALLGLLNLALLSGMPAHYAIDLGAWLERQGRNAQAIGWYEFALVRATSADLRSYLAFHIGVLHRREGDLAGARATFSRVMLQYNSNPEMVLRATQYHRALSSRDTLERRRLVIPGMETATEYKAAYCVPNSLGLVLGHWGDRVSARDIGADITVPGEGSLLTDEAFYTEERGFRHYLLPLCGPGDIRRFLDAGLPVLAFIPGHVLAIFGYDDLLETYLTYDVSTAEIWDERGQAEFAEEWARQDNLLGIVLPEEGRDTLGGCFSRPADSLNEAYLQYLLSDQSGEGMGGTASHLRRAAGRAFPPAAWEALRSLHLPLTFDPADTATESRLLQTGTPENDVILYALALRSRHPPSRVLRFLDRYGGERGWSPALTVLAAAEMMRNGDALGAAGNILNSTDFPNLDPDALPFLFRNDLLGQSEAGAQMVMNRIMAENPMNLADGGVARAAFRLWENLHRADSLNVMEGLTFLQNYLTERAPYDTAAVSDMAGLLRKKKFRDHAGWDRFLWEQRLRRARALAGEADDDKEL